MARSYDEAMRALESSARIYRSASALVYGCAEKIQDLEQQAQRQTEQLRTLQARWDAMERQRRELAGKRQAGQDDGAANRLQQQQQDMLAQIRSRRDELLRTEQQRLRLVDRLRAMGPGLEQKAEQSRALGREFEAAAERAGQTAGLTGQLGSRRFGAAAAASASAAAGRRSAEHRQGAAGAYRLAAQYEALLQRLHDLCEKTAQKVVIQDGERFLGTLPPEQRQAIYLYTTEAPGEPTYKNINRTLRDPQNHHFAPGNKQRAAAMHQALSGASLPCACTVYRGTSSAALGPYAALPDDQLAGKVIPERAFMSSSLYRRDSFGGDVLLQIEVPAGAPGAYIGSVSGAGDAESEVLFDCGQLMRITGAHRDLSGRRVVHAKMLTSNKGE